MTNDYSVDWNEEGAVFTIRRPAKFNAITRNVIAGLTEVLDDLEAGKGRSLIVMGEGEKAFCAGTDLSEASGLSPEELDAKSDTARALFFRLYKSKVITIAAVNGLAFGGGLELAMSCMFRIAAPHATMSLPEVKLAVVPAYGGTQMLPVLVGRSHALDMMLTGRTVGTDEALRIGLINRLATADEDLLTQAQAYLRTMTCYSHSAITAICDCMDTAGGVVTDEGMALEEAAVKRVAKSYDRYEGIAAFLEKRAPKFEHR